MKENKLNYYQKIKDWDFSYFDVKEEVYTNWNMFEILKNITNKNSKILDLGTGGGEKLIKNFPKVKEILGTDYSIDMIKTANENLKKSHRKNIKFKVMDNLKMDVPDNYYDVVVARNTVTDPKSIYKCLKKDGYLLLHDVDKYDCWDLKRTFGYGQGYEDEKSISIIDYEKILASGFRNVELIPIHAVEYYSSREELIKFLLKVPIIREFDTPNQYLDLDKLDEYIKRNTYEKGIKLIRRYYGIIAQK